LSGFTAADEFDGRDDELAAYATFQQPIGDWTFMPGARVVHDNRRISSPGHPEVRISRSNLFPTLHIDHQLGKALDLTLSYSKRIDRPSLNELRPYTIVQDVLNVKLGNPRLRNQSTDAYEMNLHYHRGKLDAGLIAYDRETRDLWSSAYSVVNGVNVVTLVNAGHSRDAGAEIDLSTPLFDRINLNASVNLFEQRMPVEAGNGTTTDQRFRYTSHMTLQWTGPDRGKRPGDVAQVEWIYNSPEREFELHQFAWNQLSLSYTHSLSHTLSFTGTATYSAGNRHRLEAPLVQEFFANRRPAEFRVKLLKTFGSP
jgi:outer membrane receptor protein involved in Fe transport